MRVPHPPPLQVRPSPTLLVDWPSTDIPSARENDDQASVRLLEAATKGITHWGYNDKFIALLDLEEREHDQILRNRYVQTSVVYHPLMTMYPRTITQ